MKKLTSLLIAAVMCFMLCGCAALNTTYDIVGFVQKDGTSVSPFGISKIQLGFDSEGSPAVADFYVTRANDTPIYGKLTVSEDGLGIFMPTADNAYYILSWEVMGLDKSIASAEGLRAFVESTASKYSSACIGKAEDILSKLSSCKNVTTRKEDSFELKGLGMEAEYVEIMESEPTYEEWISIIGAILSAVTENEKAWELVDEAARASYQISDSIGEYDSPKEYASEQVETAKEIFNTLKEESDDYAKVLEGSRIMVVKSDDSTVAFSVNIPSIDITIGYESACDDDKWRYDGIYLYGESPECIFVNKFTNKNTYADVLEIGEMLIPSGGAIYISHLPEEESLFGFSKGIISFKSDEAGDCTLYLEENVDNTMISMTGGKGEDSFIVTGVTDGAEYKTVPPEAEPVPVETLEDLSNLINSFVEKLSSEKAEK